MTVAGKSRGGRVEVASQL